MNDKSDQILDDLFSAVRTAQLETSRVEFGFETRVAARLREESRGSLTVWAWRLCPFFAMLALAVGGWNYANLRTDADTRIVVEATSGSDDQILLAYMTGDRR